MSGFEFQAPGRPRLEAPRRMSGKAFEFELVGGLANPYCIEPSTDQVDWQALTDVLCTTPKVTKGWECPQPRRSPR